MMKSFTKVLILSLSVSIFHGRAQADDYPMEKVTPGRCVSNPMLKNYLSDPTQYPIYFSCVYQCGNNDGSISEVTAKHVFFKGSEEEEMTQLVCRGVNISHERINGRMRGEIASISGFWAPLTDLPEILAWVKKAGVKIPAKDLQDMRTKMNLDLLTVQASYRGTNAVQFPEFAGAADILLEIAIGSVKGEEFLNQSLARIKSGTQQKTKVENIVDLNISSLGRFLL